MAVDLLTMDAPPRPAPTSAMRWLLRLVGRSSLYLVIFLCGIALLGVLSTVLPLLIGGVFDAAAQGRLDAALLATATLQILGIIVARLLIDLAKGAAIEILSKRVERDARDELYASLLAKSQAFHDRQRSGDLLARTANDVGLLSTMFSPGLDMVLGSLMHLVIPIVGIGLLRAELLVWPVLFVIAFVGALVFYISQLEPVAEALREQFGALTTVATETLSGIEVVKTVGQEAHEQGRFTAEAKRYRDLFAQNGVVQSRYLPPLLLSLATAGGLFHALNMVAAGALSLGDVVAFLGLMAVLRFPADLSIFTLAFVQFGVISAGRILEVIHDEAHLPVRPDGEHGAVRGAIRFERVSLAHRDAPVLRAVSCALAAGETVAIVGQTGSGKSTLAQLINRTYDPDTGRVLLDDIDLRDWDPGALRSQIARVEQDVFLFSRSIAQNIAFGHGPHASREQIEAAARAAEAHDFITQLPQGYDTVIGERGVTLSGGQRQRLAIARALMTDPRILILDSATSAMDAATEAAVYAHIRRALAGRTMVVITHRLAQIRQADTIIVMERGAILDYGSHQELLARCTAYARLFARPGQGHSA
ncbi:MAG TPA: ABC transporter ATP-binding protein [Roseiflexaceae bacterium]|nr:ABC transporter ATP-binding protein [Roseiflexaceae bacterium]